MGLLFVALSGIILILKLTGVEPVADWPWWVVGLATVPVTVFALAFTTAFITLIVKALK